MEIKVELGHYMPMKNMSAIREAKNLTQEQLAEMTGFGQGYLSKIEKGMANPTLDTIGKIAAALEVEPAELFALPELQQRVLTAISSIRDPERLEAALVVLEAMASGRK